VYVDHNNSLPIPQLESARLPCNISKSSSSSIGNRHEYSMTSLLEYENMEMLLPHSTFTGPHDE